MGRMAPLLRFFSLAVAADLAAAASLAPGRANRALGSAGGGQPGGSATKGGNSSPPTVLIRKDLGGVTDDTTVAGQEITDTDTTDIQVGNESAQAPPPESPAAIDDAALQPAALLQNGQASGLSSVLRDWGNAFGLALFGSDLAAAAATNKSEVSLAEAQGQTDGAARTEFHPVDAAPDTPGDDACDSPAEVHLFKLGEAGQQGLPACGSGFRPVTFVGRCRQFAAKSGCKWDAGAQAGSKICAFKAGSTKDVEWGAEEVEPTDRIVCEDIHGGEAVNATDPQLFAKIRTELLQDDGELGDDFCAPGADISYQVELVTSRHMHGIDDNLFEVKVLGRTAMSGWNSIQIAKGDAETTATAMFTAPCVPQFQGLLLHVGPRNADSASPPTAAHFEMMIKKATVTVDRSRKYALQGHGGDNDWVRTRGVYLFQPCSTIKREDACVGACTVGPEGKCEERCDDRAVQPHTPTDDSCLPGYAHRAEVDSGARCVPLNCVPDGVLPEGDCEPGKCAPRFQWHSGRCWALHCLVPNPDGMCPDHESCQDGYIREEDGSCMPANCNNVSQKDNVCVIDSCDDGFKWIAGSCWADQCDDFTRTGKCKPGGCNNGTNLKSDGTCGPPGPDDYNPHDSTTGNGIPDDMGIPDDGGNPDDGNDPHVSTTAVPNSMPGTTIEGDPNGGHPDIVCTAGYSASPSGQCQAMHCGDHDDEGKCNECNPGFGTHHSDSGRCQALNCETMDESDDGTCEVCHMGYEPIASGTCSAWNCEDDHDDKLRCPHFGCKPGWYTRDGGCVADNCKDHLPTGACKPGECKDGLTLREGACIEDNCKDGKLDASGFCMPDGCEDRFVNEGNQGDGIGRCVPMHCDSVEEHGGDCEPGKCATGYERDVNGTCQAQSCKAVVQVADGECPPGGCEIGYQWVDGGCQAANCTTPDETGKCTEGGCALGLQRDDNGGCITNNCLNRTENSNLCDACIDGYVLKDGVCVVHKCTEYLPGTGACSKCDVGFELVDGVCKSKNCAAFKPSGDCEDDKCNPMWMIADGGCIPSKCAQNETGGQARNAEGGCIECEPRFVLQEDGTCHPLNCNTPLNGAGGCTPGGCADGFVLNADNGCDPKHCKEGEVQDDGTCKEGGCAIGYHLVDGVCQARKCMEVDDTTKECKDDRCMVGYVDNGDGGCVPEACLQKNPEGDCMCTSWNTSGTTEVCDNACEIGWSFVGNSSGGYCHKTNCKSPTLDGMCPPGKCNGGFVYDGGKCKADNCVIFTPEELTCQPDGCEPGFERNAAGVCEAIHCIQHAEDLTCQQGGCADGFVSHVGTCVPDHCEQWEPSNHLCQECQDGFELVDSGLCVAINCINHAKDGKCAENQCANGFDYRLGNCEALHCKNRNVDHECPEGQCQDGYQSYDSRGCNATNCESWHSTGVCRNCSMGYANGSPCTPLHCKELVAYTCPPGKCEDGFEYNEEANACLAICCLNGGHDHEGLCKPGYCLPGFAGGPHCQPLNCEQLDVDGTCQPDGCSDYFWRDPVTKTCIAQNCDEVDPQTLQCKPGKCKEVFEYLSVGTCLAQQCVEHTVEGKCKCVRWSTDGLGIVCADSCQVGHIFQGDADGGTCIPSWCQEGATDADGNCPVGKCMVGYISENGICKPLNCERLAPSGACDPDGGPDGGCKLGFELVGATCIAKECDNLQPDGKCAPDGCKSGMVRIDGGVCQAVGCVTLSAETLKCVCQASPADCGTTACKDGREWHEDDTVPGSGVCRIPHCEIEVNGNCTEQGCDTGFEKVGDECTIAHCETESNTSLCEVCKPTHTLTAGKTCEAKYCTRFTNVGNCKSCGCAKGFQYDNTTGLCKAAHCNHVNSDGGCKAGPGTCVDGYAKQDGICAAEDCSRLTWLGTCDKGGCEDGYREMCGRCKVARCKVHKSNSTLCEAGQCEAGYYHNPQDHRCYVQNCAQELYEDGDVKCSAGSCSDGFVLFGGLCKANFCTNWENNGHCSVLGCRQGYELKSGLCVAARCQAPLPGGACPDGGCEDGLFNAGGVCKAHNCRNWTVSYKCEEGSCMEGFQLSPEGICKASNCKELDKLAMCASQAACEDGFEYSEISRTCQLLHCSQVGPSGSVCAVDGCEPGFEHDAATGSCRAAHCTDFLVGGSSCSPTGCEEGYELDGERCRAKHCRRRDEEMRCLSGGCQDGFDFHEATGTCRARNCANATVGPDFLCPEGGCGEGYERTASGTCKAVHCSQRLPNGECLTTADGGDACGNGYIYTAGRCEALGCDDHVDSGALGGECKPQGCSPGYAHDGQGTCHALNCAKREPSGTCSLEGCSNFFVAWDAGKTCKAIHCDGELTEDFECSACLEGYELKQTGVAGGGGYCSPSADTPSAPTPPADCNDTAKDDSTTTQNIGVDETEGSGSTSTPAAGSEDESTTTQNIGVDGTTTQNMGVDDTEGSSSTSTLSAGSEEDSTTTQNIGVDDTEVSSSTSTPSAGSEDDSTTTQNIGVDDTEGSSSTSTPSAGSEDDSTTTQNIGVDDTEGSSSTSTPLAGSEADDLDSGPASLANRVARRSGSNKTAAASKKAASKKVASKKGGPKGKPNRQPGFRYLEAPVERPGPRGRRASAAGGEANHAAPKEVSVRPHRSLTQ